MTHGAQPAATLHDLRPESRTFRRDVIGGLSRDPKRIPSKYLYDERGSKLFDRICRTEEYYLTRTELAIMRRHAVDMARLIGPDCLLIEYGSGSSVKIRLLLEHLESPAAYVPVDISKAHLAAAAERINQSYHALEVIPVCADFMASIEIPPSRRRAKRRVIYFPGSTLGNLDEAQADVFVTGCARVCGAGGALLIGVDLDKDPAILKPAYNDREGVTAEFNLNLLQHINRELDADFDVDQFRHEAIYNPRHHRMEMHLFSRKRQDVQIGDTTVSFDDGESVCTEHSNKYTLDRFRELAERNGFRVDRCWMDEGKLFSIQYLVVT